MTTDNSPTPDQQLIQRLGGVIGQQAIYITSLELRLEEATALLNERAKPANT